MTQVPGNSSRFPLHSALWRLCSLLVLLSVPSLSIAPAILKKPQNWWYGRLGCRKAKRSLGKPFPFLMFWPYILYGQKFVSKRYDRKYWYPWTARSILHFKLHQFNVIIFFPFLRLLLLCLFIILFQSNLFFYSQSNSCHLPGIWWLSIVDTAGTDRSYFAISCGLNGGYICFPFHF